MNKKMQFNKRLDRDKKRVALQRGQRQKMKVRGGLIVKRKDV